MAARPVAVIAADVDPRFYNLRTRPAWDVWDPLDLIPNLERALGSALPPVTWMIRADESTKQLTGDYASCLTARTELWDRLRSRGHELGWHFHHWSYGERYGFDPDPEWLPAAHAALSRHIQIRSTRTGWDYCGPTTLGQLDALGVAIDLSALPGHLIWVPFEGRTLVVDWRGASRAPYHPSADDHRSTGSLQIVEVPISCFRASAVNIVQRVGWRIAHGAWSLSGITAKVRTIAGHWPSLPEPQDGVMAAYFHPEELTDEGIANFGRNLERLRRAFDPEFVTATELARRLG